MGFRFSTSAVFALALLSNSLFSQTGAPAGASDPGWIASIQVQVQDGNGHPISGLGPDDFILTEQGERDVIVAVGGLSGAVNGAASLVGSLKSPAATKVQPGQKPERPITVPAKTMKTWVLIVLAPMSAFGRHSAVLGLEKFLSQPHPGDWLFALFDDTGEFLPFSENIETLRSRVDFLGHHTSAQQFYDGPWMSKAALAIDDLAIRPGRHAIVFASDFAFDVAELEARDPRRLLVSPSSFVDMAVRAQAPMYTLQASGPGTVVPYRSAETQVATDIDRLQWSSSTGLLVANQTISDLRGAGRDFTEFVGAADETGGRPARDMQDAFEKIATDADGFYRITFRPSNEPDGALHPISVAVRAPHAHVRSTSYYVAPTPESRQQLPAPIRAALDKGAITLGLDAAAHVWLFPGVRGRISVMAADISWPTTAGNVAPSSKLQIYAQLTDETIGRTVGSWMGDYAWKLTDGHPPMVHWQREASLYPGTYSLRVIALDAASGRLGTREFAFAIYPALSPRLQFSDVVVASRCLDRDEVQGRSNLLDPMLLDECLLAPSSSASFSVTEGPTIIVRVYTTDQQLRDMFLKQWKAYLVIGDGPRIPLVIASGDVRGLIATEKLDLSKLDLKPGINQIVVMFEAPSGDGKKHAIGLRSQLTLMAR